MNDAAGAYLAAAKAHDAARAEALRMISLIKRVAEALDRRTAAMLQATFGLKAPAGVYPYDADKIDMANWPAADQLEVALSRWHAAHSDLLATWSRIPAHERTGLSAPPTLSAH